MKSLEECLDEAVKLKSEFSSNFKELLLKYKTGDCVRVFVESIIEEAMNIYARQMCDLQIEKCAENFEKSFAVTLQIKSIRNTLNVVK
ncbi:hypothetical protein [Flavobacterium sp. NRK1]|uniref:hypothetical protein n=1 Tax=Flavobacterium sp. NRK1 TaxID=2954929 RepID=UPI0020923B4F|nr:hypothetical protein [Flavobacterium sp. NRK1]MCO6149067.1 hypothetical protein [Flavobacterium sp. NRK1]